MATRICRYRPCRKRFTTCPANIRRGWGRFCSRSCGAKQNNFLHGHAPQGHPSPEYIAWFNMHQRCGNRKHRAWKNYGGRGIKVCSKWKDFRKFLADVGRKPHPKLTLDRYPDNNGDYKPGNVRWATRTQQMLNTRRNKKHE